METSSQHAGRWPDIAGLLDPDRWLRTGEKPVWPTWRSICQPLGLLGVEHVATVSPDPCPPEVASRLRVVDGQVALLRRSTLLLRGDPVALLDRWYDLAVVSDTDLTKLPDRGVVVAYKVLERLKLPPVETRADITDRLATEPEIVGLLLADGDSVREMLVTVLAAGEAPVEVQRVLTVPHG